MSIRMRTNVSVLCVCLQVLWSATCVSSFTAPLALASTGRSERKSVSSQVTLNVATSENEVASTTSTVEEDLPKADPKDEFQTLYHVLGASPTDSHAVIRRKYTQLARQTHPDSSLNMENCTTAFSQVSQAWSVLGDPKERRRYDRSLKASQLTDNLEQWMEKGMRKAFETTHTALKTSSKTIQNVGQRFEIMKTLVDLDLQKQQCLQQAASQEALLKKLIKQLQQIDDTRIPSLQPTSTHNFTAKEARRILQLLATDTTQHMEDIAQLQQLEDNYQQRFKIRQDAQQTMHQAIQTEAALLREQEQAQDALRQAQRQFQKAQLAVQQSKQYTQQATQHDRLASVALEGAIQSIQAQQERLQTRLRQQQEDSLKERTALLHQERDRLREQADQLRQTAQVIEQEMELLAEQF